MHAADLFPLPVSAFRDSVCALNDFRNDFIFPFRADKISTAIQDGQLCKTCITRCAIIFDLLQSPLAKVWSI